MSKVIRLNERQLNTLISESVKRILREDEEMGLGSELNQREKWADYDRAEQEHIENMKSEHPDRFNTPDGYFNSKGAEYSDELAWDSEDFDPTNEYNPYDTEGNFDRMGYNDFDSIEDEDFGEEEFQNVGERENFDDSLEDEDDLDKTIYEAIHRVAREQFRNRKK